MSQSAPTTTDVSQQPAEKSFASPEPDHEKRLNEWFRDLRQLHSDIGDVGSGYERFCALSSSSSHISSDISRSRHWFYDDGDVAVSQCACNIATEAIRHFHSDEQHGNDILRDLRKWMISINGILRDIDSAQSINNSLKQHTGKLTEYLTKQQEHNDDLNADKERYQDTFEWTKSVNFWSDLRDRKLAKKQNKLSEKVNALLAVICDARTRLDTLFKQIEAQYNHHYMGREELFNPLLCRIMESQLHFYSYCNEQMLTVSHRDLKEKNDAAAKEQEIHFENLIGFGDDEDMDPSTGNGASAVEESINVKNDGISITKHLMDGSDDVDVGEERKEEQMRSDDLLHEVFGAHDAMPKSVEIKPNKSYTERTKQVMQRDDVIIHAKNNAVNASNGSQDKRKEDTEQSLQSPEPNAEQEDMEERMNNDGSKPTEKVLAEVFNALQESPEGVRDYIGHAFPDMRIADSSVHSNKAVVNANGNDVSAVEQSNAERNDGDLMPMMANAEIMDAVADESKAEHHVRSEDLFAEVFGQEMAAKDNECPDYLQNAFMSNNVQESQNESVVDDSNQPQMMDLMNLDDD